MDKKQKNEIKSNKNTILFWLEKTINKNNFIDFKKLISTILIKNSLKESDLDVSNFIKKINKSLNAYETLNFSKFLLDFEINEKFDLNKKIPFIKEIKELNKGINWSSNFEKLYNQEILELINNFYVEFLPNIILYLSNDSKKIKIYITSKYFSNNLEVKGSLNGNN